MFYVLFFLNRLRVFLIHAFIDNLQEISNCPLLPESELSNGWWRSSTRALSLDDLPQPSQEEHTQPRLASQPALLLRIASNLRSSLNGSREVISTQTWRTLYWIINKSSNHKLWAIYERMEEREELERKLGVNTCCNTIVQSSSEWSVAVRQQFSTLLMMSSDRPEGSWCHSIRKRRHGSRLLV